VTLQQLVQIAVVGPSRCAAKIESRRHLHGRHAPAAATFERSILKQQRVFGALRLLSAA